jgi:predicted dehydrogenase
MKKRQIRVGLVGTGFMGRTHSNAWRQAGIFFSSSIDIVLAAACSRNAAEAEGFAQQWGYSSFETDWRRLVEREDIDLVDIASPNDTHAEIAIAALRAGKMVACEKPLGMSAAQSAAMVAVAKEADLPTMVWYNYRRVPALRLAKDLVEEGRLGRIFHYRTQFLQDWTISRDLPQGGRGLWRLDAAVAGSGVTGDLLAHCIDAALWLNGGISEVTAVTETFIKERQHVSSGEMQSVSIDDASLVLARFSNGSLGSFEATRYARGHKAKFTLEINGEHGSLAWDLHDLHRLAYFEHGPESKVRGWRSIHVSDSDQPYMEAWWVPGLQIGYEHTFIHQVADFLKGLESGQVLVPDFAEANRTDVVADAILRSAEQRAWRAV